LRTGEELPPASARRGQLIKGDLEAFITPLDVLAQKDEGVVGHHHQLNTHQEENDAQPQFEPLIKLGG